MNWARIRLIPWIDTRARFVALVPQGGSLLDLGSSDGETLRHIAELRPDLRLHAVDLAGAPENYPAGCRFHRADLRQDRLPWAEGSFDAITCMHLVEHLSDTGRLMGEVARLLKPGGRVYVETPQAWTVDLKSPPGARQVGYTFNFFDDATHVRPVPLERIAAELQSAGLLIVRRGTSRNWLFAATHLIYQFLPPSRKKYTAHVHWLGWSACLVASKQ